MSHPFAIPAFVSYLLLLSAGSVYGDEPRFLLVEDSSGKPAAIELRGLSAEQLGHLKNSRNWPAAFAVRVANAPGDAPTVAGTFMSEGGVIRFTPRFRLQGGLAYEASLPEQRRAGIKAISMRLEIAADQHPTMATALAAIYPSADKLPENQLKFYLHFSAPMSRGEAYEHVRLLKEDGEVVDLPFLEIGEELWDRSGKRLTLLIDPGRIKQGVKPREDIGPVLEAGRSYKLAIDKTWHDATGRPLAADFTKQFTARAPVSGALDTRQWKIEPPKSGTTEPLRVSFPAPLDHALLQRTLWIESARGSLEGEVGISDGERQWSFTPQQPWTSDPHWLVVDTVLEDLGGNRIGSAFEVDALDPLQKRLELKTVRLPVPVSSAAQ